MLRTVRGLGLLFVLAAMPHVVGAQTRAFLEAPRVHSRIRVTWSAKDKKISYEVDDDRTPREIVPDAIFVTSTSVFVTYPKINPLKLQASAAVTEVDDPSHATIAKLLEGIMGVATTVRPELRAAAGTPAAAIGAAPLVCAELTKASEELATLNKTLFEDKTTPGAVKDEVDGWIAAIDVGYGTTTSGSAAVGMGVVKIGAFVATLTKDITDATAVIVRVEVKAAETGPFATPCPQQAHELYQIMRLTNPRARLQQLSALKAAAAELQKALKADYVDDAGQWLFGTEYKISKEIKPTDAKMQKVVVKTATITFKVDEVTSALVIAQQDAGSATFTVRRYSAFAPEVGVGAVFGFIDRPQYGTSKNAAGETIVARVPDDSFSVNPSILANFVCRCGAGPIAPMLQLGASTSKDVPAILAGGGLRLFGAGAGDVAVGGGWMFAWVKDLQKLKEGDIVPGTKDIDADLGFARAPRIRGYFVIQYKF